MYPRTLQLKWFPGELSQKNILRYLHWTTFSTHLPGFSVLITEFTSNYRLGHFMARSRLTLNESVWSWLISWTHYPPAIGAKMSRPLVGWFWDNSLHQFSLPDFFMQTYTYTLAWLVVPLNSSKERGYVVNSREEWIGEVNYGLHTRRIHSEHNEERQPRW